ncbi:hypothetical protein BKA58DRAFT_403147 [Alternaria rosae]|uniref:uncharacterized protein n=1 Tax=Alternaria rosae TaxID=1187941 RepID=UPI001E8CC787|nr:uncharacterized protein BKA58DRAFT_403147 [Alternaria rosae]KAH6868814.1 hypothetical protein BKA58DRAFT_403147 [Alternaria rosae]
MPKLYVDQEEGLDVESLEEDDDRVHARREELIRAFNKLKAAGCTGSALCPSCPKSYKTAAKWLTHPEHHHREELWLREDEEDEEENSVLVCIRLPPQFNHGQKQLGCCSRQMQILTILLILFEGYVSLNTFSMIPTGSCIPYLSQHLIHNSRLRLDRQYNTGKDPRHYTMQYCGADRRKYLHTGGNEPHRKVSLYQRQEVYSQRTKIKHGDSD